MECSLISEDILQMKVVNLLEGLNKFLSILNKNDGILVAEIREKITLNIEEISEILKNLNDRNMKLIFMGNDDFKVDLINLIINDFEFSFNKIVKRNVILKNTLDRYGIKLFEEEESNYYSKNDFEKILKKHEMEFQEAINKGKAFESFIESIEIEQDINLEQIEMEFDFNNKFNDFHTENVKLAYVYVINLFNINESQLRYNLNDYKSIIDKGHLISLFVFGSQNLNIHYSKIINEYLSDTSVCYYFTYREFDKQQLINLISDLKEKWDVRNFLKLTQEFNKRIEILHKYLRASNETFLKISGNYLDLDLDFGKLNNSIIERYLYKEIETIMQTYKNIINKEISRFRYKAKLQYVYDDFKDNIEKLKITLINNKLDNKVTEIYNRIIKQIDDTYEVISKKNDVSNIERIYISKEINYDKFGENVTFEFDFRRIHKYKFFLFRFIDYIKDLVYFQKNRGQIVSKVSSEAANIFRKSYLLFFEYLYNSSLENILKYKSSLEKNIRKNVEENYIKKYGDLLKLYDLQNSFKSILFILKESKVKEDVNRNEFKA